MEGGRRREEEEGEEEDAEEEEEKEEGEEGCLCSLLFRPIKASLHTTTVHPSKAFNRWTRTSTFLPI